MVNPVSRGFIVSFGYMPMLLEKLMKVTVVEDIGGYRRGVVVAS
jgi:hypothetical protein